MSSGDLADALALASVALDGGVVQIERIAADVTAFDPGAPNARAADDGPCGGFED
jgi:hypothetical protein